MAHTQLPAASAAGLADGERAQPLALYDTDGERIVLSHSLPPGLRVSLQPHTSVAREPFLSAATSASVATALGAVWASWVFSLYKASHRWDRCALHM
jgi:hypothetical protein